MLSNYMLINKYKINSADISEIKALLKSTSKNSFYISDEEDELIEFVEISSLSELENEHACNTFCVLKSVLQSDVKREVLVYEESPISTQRLIPNSKYVQLRHVEVIPSLYEQYRQWRISTIFKVVKENRHKIKGWDSYHSLISNIPGVMFISQFDVDISDYLEPFIDSNYKNIVSQAGNYIITDSGDGLYTKIYNKLQD